MSSKSLSAKKSRARCKSNRLLAKELAVPKGGRFFFGDLSGIAMGFRCCVGFSGWIAELEQSRVSRTVGHGDRGPTFRYHIQVSHWARSPVARRRKERGAKRRPSRCGLMKKSKCGQAATGRLTGFPTNSCSPTRTSIRPSGKSRTKLPWTEMQDPIVIVLSITDISR